MDKFQIISNDLVDTFKIAEKFSSVVTTGDIIILEGDLGAGKTHFVKGFAKSFNYTGNVTSPTFNIAFFYNTEQIKIIHIDLYRIDEVKEFNDLGLTEYFDEAVVLIEWGEKIKELFDEYVYVKIDYYQRTKRQISFSFKGEKYKGLLEKLQIRCQSL